MPVVPIVSPFDEAIPEDVHDHEHEEENNDRDHVNLQV
jgi:hypothetical protein